MGWPLTVAAFCAETGKAIATAAAKIKRFIDILSIVVIKFVKFKVEFILQCLKALEPRRELGKASGPLIAHKPYVDAVHVLHRQTWLSA